MKTEPISFRNLSIHDRASMSKAHPFGTSPDSVLDSSAHSPTVQPWTASFICQRDRVHHDAEALRDPLKTINSEVFKFLDNGYIIGPGRTGYSGLVHKYSEVNRALTGQADRRIISAEWGSMIRPEPPSDNPDNFRYLPGRFAAKSSHRYFDDTLVRGQSPVRLPLIDMGIRGDMRPDIALHGDVHYPKLTWRCEGPFGTPSFRSETWTKRFTVRVPLEYALKRAVRRGLSSPTKKSGQ